MNKDDLEAMIGELPAAGGEERVLTAKQAASLVSQTQRRTIRECSQIAAERDSETSQDDQPVYIQDGGESRENATQERIEATRRRLNINPDGSAKTVRGITMIEGTDVDLSLASDTDPDADTRENAGPIEDLAKPEPDNARDKHGAGSYWADE